MFLTLDSTDHEHYRTGYIAAAVGNCLPHSVRQAGRVGGASASAHGAAHARGAERDLPELRAEARQLVQDPRRYDAVDRVAKRAGEARWGISQGSAPEEAPLEKPDKVGFGAIPRA